MKQFGLSVLLAAIAFVFCVNISYGQEELYEKAVTAYIKKDFRTAAAYLREYVAKKPDAEAYYLLGYSTYMLGKKNRRGKYRKADKEAAGYFEEAYLINPAFSPKDIDFTKFRDRAKGD